MVNYTKSNWRKISMALAVSLALTGILFSGKVFAEPEAPKVLDIAQHDAFYPAGFAQGTSVDHSQFSALQGPFERPQDVTKACISCHANAADEVMHTTHWTWQFVNDTTGQILGKQTLVNNFCVAIDSNEARCTSCHVGYGWVDDTFDFTIQENVDCLVCHDTTGEYKKFPTGAGYPVSEPTEFPAGSGNIWQPPDLAKVAQNIGLTSRQTCGSCHFFGGGGDEVKHGDLDSSLTHPSFELDVHMSADGQDFTCTSCHATDAHQMVGSRYSMDLEEWIGCEGGHTNTPHDLAILNKHDETVACQTCHIPEYARGDIPTKMSWDWSKAGQFGEDGKPLVIKDEDGHVIYNGLKGEFTLEGNVVPEYVWFNGQVSYTLASDQIDPSDVVSINQFLGDKNDPDARIWPVKRFTGAQPYDSVNNILAIPHLFGKDENAYWKNFDWDKAITAGMEYADMKYSGEYGFVDTEMYWPITHMVAPANEAVQCAECHTTDNSRLNFSALGYSDTEISRLTKFPPTLTLEESAPPEYSPEACSNCHTIEHGMWMESLHGSKGVGCVSCHQLEGDGEHPVVVFSIEQSADTCGACHLDEYHDWQHSRHGEISLACSSCHNPHSQDMLTVDGNQTACANCHRSQTEDSQHSSHAQAGLLCTDCHLNTDENTGHTFVVGSDTCIKCHGEGIHSSEGELQADTDMPEATVKESADTHLVSVEAEAEEVGGVPIWASAFFIIVLSFGGYTLFGNHSKEKDDDLSLKGKN